MYITRKNYFQCTISEKWNDNITATVVLLCFVNLNRLVCYSRIIHTFSIQRGQFNIYTVICATFAHWWTWKSLSPTMIKVESWTSIKIFLMAHVLWTFGQVLARFAPIAVHLLPSWPIGLTLHVAVCACTCQRSIVFFIVLCEVLHKQQLSVLGYTFFLTLPTDCSSFVRGNITTLCKAVVLELEDVG